jgi:subtilisin family serine protease
VLDSGISPHPDLNVIGGRNFAPDASDPNDWTDQFVHGTPVAGIIGARNNGMGVWGVLPGAPLFAGKVLSDLGRGDSLSTVGGMLWVVQNGVSLNITVVNLSLTGKGKDQLLCDAIQAAVDKGMVVVAAAGNGGVEMSDTLPGNCGAAIAVTALDTVSGSPSGAVKPASFSNWWVCCSGRARHKQGC